MATIPFLGLGLSDLAKIGADTYNAKALGEYEAQRIQRENEDREQKRRDAALARAISELELETLQDRRARSAEELRRIQQGLPPVPEAGTTPVAPEIGLGARDWKTYEERFGAQTVLEEDRLTRLETIRERFRPADRDDSNEPPSLNMVQDASAEIVQSVLAGNPLMTPEQINQMVESEEGLAQLSPAMRLLVEGGQVNSMSINAAYHRVRRAQLEQDAVFQSMKQSADEACQAGASADEITLAAESNPNFARFEDAFLAHVDTLSCG